MVITYGTSYVGKIDRVPGRFYVVTQVFQVVNVPLFPLRGFVVWEGTEELSFVRGLYAFQGLEVPVDKRSFAWGLARAAWFCLALLTSLGIVSIWSNFESSLAAAAVGPFTGIALFVGWWRTRHGLSASPERARALEALIESMSARVGMHLRTVLKLTPLQAAMGGQHEIPLEHPDLCESCNGQAGAESPCITCGGSGSGFVRRSFVATVPPGVENGQTIRCKHQGARHPSGAPGHLFVEIVVEPNQPHAVQ